MIDNIRTEKALARYKALIEDCRDLLTAGASVAEMQARTSDKFRATQSWVRKSLAAGLIFSNHRGTATRYFLDFDDMQRHHGAYEAQRVARTKERDALRYKREYKPKVSKPAMPKSYTAKRVTPAGNAFKSMTAHRPAHVKTQYCPAGIDQRFTPCEPFPKIFSSMRIGTYL